MPGVLDIRQIGLWLAVELESGERVRAVIRRCLALGLVTDWFLFNDRALRIAPPLTITEAEIGWACGVLAKALQES